MITGTRVRIDRGVHHGKRGTVASVRLTGEGDHTRAVPTIVLSDNTLVEVSGKDLTVVR